MHPERHEKADEAEDILLLALPAFEAVAGGRVLASVSIRHDPLEAVEELVQGEPVDEIILSISAHKKKGWLHPDLSHRLQALGVPVADVPTALSLAGCSPSLTCSGSGWCAVFWTS